MIGVWVEGYALGDTGVQRAVSSLRGSGFIVQGLGFRVKWLGFRGYDKRCTLANKSTPLVSRSNRCTAIGSWALYPRGKDGYKFDEDLLKNALRFKVLRCRCSVQGVGFMG